MHTYYYKIVKQLKSLKIIIVAPTCLGLHKQLLLLLLLLLFAAIGLLSGGSGYRYCGCIYSHNTDNCK